MNRVGNHARMGWSLLVGANWVPVALIIVYGIMVLGFYSDGGTTAVTWFAYLLVNSATLIGFPLDQSGYRVLNLSSALYRRHAQISLTIRFFGMASMLMAIAAQESQLRWWLAGGILLALYLWQVLSQRSLAEPGDLLARARGRGIGLGEDTTATTIEVRDLATELIVKPQAKFWLGTWAWAIVFGVGTLLFSRWWGDGDLSLANIVGILCFALLFAAASGSISETLSRWVAFGGSRLCWAHHTRRVMLIHPVLGAVLVAVVVLIDDTQGPAGILLPLIGALMGPAIICLIQLAQRSTAAYLVVAVLVAAVVTAALITGYGWLALAIAAVGFVGFEVALPRIARDYDAFTGGVREFFGLQPVAA